MKNHSTMPCEGHRTGSRWHSTKFCDTIIVALRNLTITVEEEVARWARRKAAEEDTSVSKLVGRMLEREMRLNDDYWRAYERWKQLAPLQGIDAGRPATREEIHERR